MIQFSALQLTDMLAVQNKLNTTIYGPLWRNKKFEWHRLAWMECANIMDNIGWKWWGEQKLDLGAAQLGAASVWQSCMSYALEATHAQLHTDDVYVTAESIRNDMALAKNSLTFGFAAQVKLHGEIPALLNLVELLVSQCVGDQQVSPAITLELAEVLGFEVDDLYHLFLVQNLMLLFRDEYGHQKGVYHRQWDDGKEDQEVLTEVVKAHPEWNSTQVYEELRLRYGRPVPEAAP